MLNSEGIEGRTVSEQAIRERAYALYEQRGSAGGHAEEDWLRAESELFAEADRPKAA